MKLFLEQCELGLCFPLIPLFGKKELEYSCTVSEPVGPL